MLGHFSDVLCDTWHNVPAALPVPLPSPVFLNIELSVCQIKSLHCSKLSISEEEVKSESDLPTAYLPALLLLHSISFSPLDSHGRLTIQSHQAHAGLRAFALALSFPGVMQFGSLPSSFWSLYSEVTAFETFWIILPES